MMWQILAFILATAGAIPAEGRVGARAKAQIERVLDFALVDANEGDRLRVRHQLERLAARAEALERRSPYLVADDPPELQGIDERLTALAARVGDRLRDGLASRCGGDARTQRAHFAEALFAVIEAHLLIGANAGDRGDKFLWTCLAHAGVGGIAAVATIAFGTNLGELNPATVAASGVSLGTLATFLWNEQRLYDLERQPLLAAPLVRAVSARREAEPLRQYFWSQVRERLQDVPEWRTMGDFSTEADDVAYRVRRLMGPPVEIARACEAVLSDM